MKLKSYIIASLLLFTIFSPATSKSQSEDAERLSEKSPAQEQQLLRDKEIYAMVEALRETHLIQELGLPEQKAASLIEKMRYARELRQKYLVQRFRVENTLDTLLLYPTRNQDKISSVLQELELAKEQYRQQIVETDKELQQMLTQEERAKYVLFQRNFNRKLKGIILNIRQQRLHSPQQQNQLLRKQASESVIRQSQ